MEYSLRETYVDDNGNRVHNVVVGKTTLKGFKAYKLDRKKCRKCKYKYDCYNEKVVRKYDCAINANWLKRAFNFLTSILALIWSYYVFDHFAVNFYYKLAFIFVTLACFDIFCTLVEEGVPKIYDWLFEQKVKRKLKVYKKEKAEEEAKAKVEEEARIRDIQGYLGVKKAKTVTESFIELAKQCKSDSITAIVNSCVECCEIIMKILEKNSGDYYRVCDVFEMHLPRVCTAMEMYKKSMEADVITDEQQLLFEELINSASKYLDKKKNEVIYYNNVDEADLKSSADSLKTSLQEENKK